jgi:hypothetical protein
MDSPAKGQDLISADKWISKMGQSTMYSELQSSLFSATGLCKAGGPRVQTDQLQVCLDHVFCSLGQRLQFFWQDPHLS